ncbi:MAG: hypothetical protein KF884_06275 [Fimbriimonadaceae bacterium]|nr:hypothetical protein [Fimbriimonadaceae bacterium]QYK59691.1 MAG: hypothetical protein KF884_06275 [Fimbriimonadaceae bacterium]
MAPGTFQVFGPAPSDSKRDRDLSRFVREFEDDRHSLGLYLSEVVPKFPLDAHAEIDTVRPRPDAGDQAERLFLTVHRLPRSVHVSFQVYAKSGRRLADNDRSLPVLPHPADRGRAERFLNRVAALSLHRPPVSLPDSLLEAGPHPRDGLLRADRLVSAYRTALVESLAESLGRPVVALLPDSLEHDLIDLDRSGRFSGKQLAKLLLSSPASCPVQIDLKSVSILRPLMEEAFEAEPIDWEAALREAEKAFTTKWWAPSSMASIALTGPRPTTGNRLFGLVRKAARSARVDGLDPLLSDDQLAVIGAVARLVPQLSEGQSPSGPMELEIQLTGAAAARFLKHVDSLPEAFMVGQGGVETDLEARPGPRIASKLRVTVVSQPVVALRKPGADWSRWYAEPEAAWLADPGLEGLERRRGRRALLTIDLAGPVKLASPWTVPWSPVSLDD